MCVLVCVLACVLVVSGSGEIVYSHEEQTGYDLPLEEITAAIQQTLTAVPTSPSTSAPPDTGGACAQENN